MSRDRVFYRGTVEYLIGTVTTDVDLTGDTVEVSFDNRESWIPAEWIGSTNRWRILLDETTMPEVDRFGVHVRITDNPEIPVLKAGTVLVR